MHLVEGIRRIGFRKWYERELLQSHAHLALCFCCVVGLFAAMEALRQNPDWLDQAVDVAALIIFGAAGLWSLRRYLYLLNHAEYVAHQADCPSCGTYARFTLVGLRVAQGAVGVRCSECQHEWRIDDASSTPEA